MNFDRSSQWGLLVAFDGLARQYAHGHETLCQSGMIGAGGDRGLLAAGHSGEGIHRAIETRSL